MDSPAFWQAKMDKIRFYDLQDPRRSELDMTTNRVRWNHFRALRDEATRIRSQRLFEAKNTAFARVYEDRVDDPLKSDDATVASSSAPVVGSPCDWADA